MEWVRKSADTFTATIFIAGQIELIKSICAEYCSDGFCVSIAPVDYIYKYGQESGAAIKIINYPRFPETNERLTLKAEKLGFLLAEKLHQGSFTVQANTETIFYDRRG